jgi:hypothetical protein
VFSGLPLLINSAGVEVYDSRSNGVGYRLSFKDIGNSFCVSRQSSQAIPLCLPFSRLPLLDVLFLIALLLSIPTKKCLPVPSALESSTPWS